MGILYGLTAVAIFIIGFVIYYIIQFEKPQTLGTVYANGLSCTEEDINIVEVKIHSNENNNGQVCYEVLFNGYTDYIGGAVKGFGMQLAGDYTGQHAYTTISGEQAVTWYGGIQLYNTDDYGVSSYVTSNMPNELYIDIDGAFYKICFETFKYNELKSGFWNSVFGKTEEKELSYNFYSLFDYIVNSALSDSARFENGEYSISLLDCSKFIKFMYQDTDTQYKDLPKTSTMYEFLKIHVTYSKDGMIDASQSLFHQYYGNSSWNYYNNTDIENYWNAYANLELTEANMNYVYNEEKSAYYITIDENFAKYLQGLSNANISLNINTSNLDFEIYGIDLYNFYFKIKSFEITADSVEDFVMYNQTSCDVVPTIKAV